MTGSAAGAPSATATVAPDCADGPGRRVEQLPDVVVPAVRVSPVTAASADGGPGQVVPGFTIPRQLVDAGCVIYYEAPGGCLGAVEITGAVIPPAVIPRSVLPAATGPNGLRVDEREFPAVTVPGASAPGVRAEQVCQVELDGELPTVSRAGVVRPGFSRSGASRPGGTRPQQCAGDACIPAVEVPTVRLEPVRLPDVDVDPARLESRELGADSTVDVFTGEGRVSYVAPGDVLFDTDEATIRPDAARALQAIAQRIAATSAGAALLVEGHTDDRGDETYGLRLSERRARAVADWLTANAGIDPARITTRGLGETAPAVPNDSDANRQQNRRVVITLTSS